MEDNIISNRCFLRRCVSGELVSNTDDSFSSDWELVLSSSVIQLRGCITWLTHVPHMPGYSASFSILEILHDDSVAISCRTWNEGGRC